MRGASAPPMSPPLLPRLPCIQIHPPNIIIKQRGTTDHSKADACFQINYAFFWFTCVQTAPLCARWRSADRDAGTLESAPTCAPLLTAFLCAVWIYKNPLWLQRRLHLKTVSLALSHGCGATELSRLQQFFFVRRHGTCIDICAQKNHCR